MSDDGSGRVRRKTRRAKRRALRVPLDEVPRTSAVAPPPESIEPSVEIDLEEVVEPREAAAVEQPEVSQHAVTVMRAVMISEPSPGPSVSEPPPGPSVSEPPPGPSVSEPPPAPSVSKSEEPSEDTHELEIEDAAIEQVPPAEEDDADMPEVLLGEAMDADFDHDLEDVPELPGAPTIPGRSLAELEEARQQALGVSVEDDASEELDEEELDEEELDEEELDEEELDEEELDEEELDEEDPDEEELDSGEIEIESSKPSEESGVKPSAEAPPPPPTEHAPLPEGLVQSRRRAWFEDFFNDDYLRTVRSPMAPQVARQCDFIIEALGLAPGATILDVGCGLGLHAIELTARGYLVVGLDLSLPMLSRASDEAQDRSLKINFLHGDMREMTFEGAFDAALCWGTTFGYFDDDSNRRVASRMRRALKPGGKLLLDVTNRDHVLRTQPNLVWFEGDGCVVMEETSLNYFSSRLQVKRTVILDDGRQRDTRYSIRLYALHELGQLLHQEGFRVAEVSGLEATRGVFFGAASPRLIVLAERRAVSSGSSQTLESQTTSAQPPATPPAQSPTVDSTGDSPEVSLPASEALDPEEGSQNGSRGEPESE